MRTWHRIGPWLAVLIVTAQAAAQPLVRPGPQLQADGIPVFARHAAVARAEAPALRLLDWHPLRPEMLVLKRHGGSLQLHALTSPGAPPRLLSEGREPVESARWEPASGDYLVLRQDSGGDEAWRLFMLVPGAVPRAISPADARASEYRFLPDGRGLVYVLDRLDRQVDKHGERRPLSRLVWVQPRDPQQTRVLAELPGGRYGSLQVSASGRITALQTVGQRSQLMEFALDGAAPRPVGTPVASEVPVDGGEPGDDDEPRPRTHAQAAPAAERRWSLQAQRGDFRHLVATALTDGRREALLAGQPADIEALAEAPDGRLALVYNEQGLSRLRLFDPASGRLEEPAQQPPAGLLRQPLWHPRLPLLAFEHVSAQQPGRLWVLDLSEPAAPALRAWSGGDARGDGGRGEIEYRALQWRSFDGLAISALHVAPPARFSGPRPVYISLHGGPSSQSRPGPLSGVPARLVEEFGMHLILPNVRGSTGFGKRFTDLDNGRRREDATRDVSALLDLIATRPDMDASKVIVAGGSYGGYLSLAVAAQEADRIAGSICRVGIANFVSFLEHTESYRRDNRRAEYGDERDPAMRAFLQTISPLNRAERVRKPLFVVHGRNDPRVPWSEAQAMVAAVRAHGTPVWFLTAEDEGHSFGKADNSDYLTQATLEFVRRVLEGQSLHQPADPVRPPAVSASAATEG